MAYFALRSTQRGFNVISETVEGELGYATPDMKSYVIGESKFTFVKDLNTQMVTVSVNASYNTSDFISETVSPPIVYIPIQKYKCTLNSLYDHKYVTMSTMGSGYMTQGCDLVSINSHKLRRGPKITALGGNYNAHAGFLDKLTMIYYYINNTLYGRVYLQYDFTFAFASEHGNIFKENLKAQITTVDGEFIGSTTIRLSLEGSNAYLELQDTVLYLTNVLAAASIPDKFLPSEDLTLLSDSRCALLTTSINFANISPGISVKLQIDRDIKLITMFIYQKGGIVGGIQAEDCKFKYQI